MEYGVRLAKPRISFGDPREFCGDQLRTLLPDGPLRSLYFGSEFCEDLLPDLSEASQFFLLAQTLGLEPVLLTPLVRPRGLERVRQLLDGLIEQGKTMAIVFNDWGVFRLLRDYFPTLERRAGRLINRALRDPRLAEGTPSSPVSSTARGGCLRAMLANSGVAALETDPDLDGTYLGEPGTGLRRVLHLPFAFAASGRNCLFKAEGRKGGGNFAAWIDQRCEALCRERCHPVERGDLKHPLWRAGNTLFYEVPMAGIASHLGRADRIVIHERPLP